MNKIKSIYKKNEEVTRLLVIMAVWLIFMAFTQARKFYTGMNFLTMAGQFPEYGLMALGGMLCMITGGIDLSVVGTANMASIYTDQIVWSRRNYATCFFCCDLPDCNCNRYCCWKSERLFDLKTWGSADSCNAWCK